MMTSNHKKDKSNAVTFIEYKRNGCSYIKARQWVTLIDGTVERLEGNGKNRVDARASLCTKIEKRNKEIEYGMKKDNGEITLAESVKLLIEERSKEYEDICIEILKNVLGEYLGLWKVQESSNNGLYRFDLCCKIKNNYLLF